VRFEALDLNAEEHRRLDELLAGDGRRDLADDLTLAGWGEFLSLEGTFEAFAEDFVAPVAEKLRQRGVELDA
jgi:hypothetical protein